MNVLRVLMLAVIQNGTYTSCTTCARERSLFPLDAREMCVMRNRDGMGIGPWSRRLLQVGELGRGRIAREMGASESHRTPARKGSYGPEQLCHAMGES